MTLGRLLCPNLLTWQRLSLHEECELCATSLSEVHDMAQVASIGECNPRGKSWEWARNKLYKHVWSFLESRFHESGIELGSMIETVHRKDGKYNCWSHRERGVQALHHPVLITEDIYNASTEFLQMSINAESEKERLRRIRSEKHHGQKQEIWLT